MARTLGSEIKKVRQVKGLSLSAAATPAGVSATYLQKLERDRVGSPSPRRLERLAEVLGIEYADLLRLAGYNVPDRSEGEVEGDNATGASEPVSAVRRMFLSEDQVSDDELEELVRYLAFIRQQRSAE